MRQGSRIPGSAGMPRQPSGSLPVSRYRKPRTQPRPEQCHVCDVRPVWTPWGWAVERKRLLWLIDNWCTGNRTCSSCLINTRFRRTRRELCSRCAAAFRTSATTSAKTGGRRTGIGRTIGGRGWRDGCCPPSIRHHITAPQSKGRIGPRSVSVGAGDRGLPSRSQCDFRPPRGLHGRWKFPSNAWSGA